MPSIADLENYNGTPLQEKTTMSENNTPTPTSLDMSRINRLRDSERRKKVEHERNEKLILQMSSYEGMNKLAQLEGELTSKLNNGSSNNSNLNGIDNPSFSNDTATKIATLCTNQTPLTTTQPPVFQLVTRTQIFKHFHLWPLSTKQSTLLTPPQNC